MKGMSRIVNIILAKCRYIKNIFAENTKNTGVRTTYHLLLLSQICDFMGTADTAVQNMVGCADFTCEQREVRV